MKTKHLCVCVKMRNMFVDLASVAYMSSLLASNKNTAQVRPHFDS